jgi:hypothetical protein
MRATVAGIVLLFLSLAMVWAMRNMPANYDQPKHARPCPAAVAARLSFIQSLDNWWNGNCVSR